MGKTSMGMNLAKNIAQIHELPVCIFSFEMSKEQITYRLLSMEVGIESGRLRTGRLTQDEWPVLGQGINTLGQLPIFFSDDPLITVEDMAEKCKKIKKQQNKELGLVLVDYVQLRDGPFPEHSQQELDRVPYFVAS